MQKHNFTSISTLFEALPITLLDLAGDQTSLMPLETLLLLTKRFEDEAHGIMRRAHSWLSEKDADPNNIELFIALIYHGQQYGLAGHDHYGETLWQVAAHMLQKHQDEEKI